MDNFGGEVTFNPINPGSAQEFSIDDGTELSSVACPRTTQCIALDVNGDELTFNPTSPGVPSPVQVDSGGLTGAVACPTATQCTAVDYDGYEVTFNPENPAAPTNSGTAVQVDPGGTDLFDVACPAATQCTALGDNDLGANDFEVTFNPQAPPPPITINPIYSGPTPVSINSGVAVACPTATQCTTIGSGVEETFNPQNPGAPTALTVDSKGGLAAIACPAATQCIAVGGGGSRSHSTQPAPANQQQSASTATEA